MSFATMQRHKTIPLAKSTEIREQGLNTRKGKQDATKLQPAITAISHQESSGKVWREAFQDGCVVHDEVLRYVSDSD
jgi:hypothetical protein